MCWTSLHLEIVKKKKNFKDVNLYMFKKNYRNCKITWLTSCCVNMLLEGRGKLTCPRPTCFSQGPRGRPGEKGAQSGVDRPSFAESSGVGDEEGVRYSTKSNLCCTLLMRFQLPQWWDWRITGQPPSVLSLKRVAPGPASHPPGD